MRQCVLIGLILFLAGCQYYEDDDNAGYGCSMRDQKRFVRDATEYWYLWNDMLPDKTRVGDYDDPVELLADLTGVQPLDSFSYIGSAAADAAFFGAGQYEGFGFSWLRSASGDIRVTRVFTGSPAEAAGFLRGQQLLAIDGRPVAEIEADGGISAALDAPSAEFTMLETDGAAQFTITVAKSVVTIEPVPQWRLISSETGPPVGYIEFSTFISTADPQLQAAFGEFRDNGVTDVIIDLRYNGGGLLSTAQLLGNLLGGDVAENLVFTGTRFNPDRAEEYNADTPFLRLMNSISLSRLVVIATENTASASELVINGMEPHVEVTLVGDRTFGKPVGQIGLEFCGNILRLTAFQNVNANGSGDYFDGLAVDCAATDDLQLPVGDPNDPNMLAALDYLATGSCPPQPAPLQRQHAGREESPTAGPEPAHREFAGAW